MATANIGHIPTQNPCAQCGSPIPLPEWIEDGEGRTAYLWHCRVCNYRFEAVAIFEHSDADSRPLAA